MTILDNFFWALRQIKKRLLESLLIILGIGFGVAVICGVVGLMQGYDRQMDDYMDSIHYRTFEVEAVQDSFNMSTLDKPLDRVGDSQQEIVNLSFEDYQDLKNSSLKGLDAVWLSGRRAEPLPNVDVSQRPKDPNKMMEWRDKNFIEYCMTTPDTFQKFDYELIKGDFFRESDLESKNKVTVIGDERAKKMFGDENPIGKEIKMRSAVLTVIGVVHFDSEKYKTEDEDFQYIPGLGLTNRLNDKLYVPYFSYGYYNNSDVDKKIRTIHIMTEEGTDVGGFYGRLKDYVERKYPKGVNIAGTYLQRHQIKEQRFAISSLITVFACAALLIAAINILNLMMARVLRRYRNIGISAAMGASKRDIFKIFLSESLILGLFGSLVGILLAYGGLTLLTKLIRIKMGLTLTTWLIGIGTALITSLIFGLYPASQASRINPVNALKMD